METMDKDFDNSLRNNQLRILTFGNGMVGLSKQGVSGVRGNDESQHQAKSRVAITSVVSALKGPTKMSKNQPQASYRQACIGSSCFALGSVKQGQNAG
jgi:hypothetical protein